MFKVLVEQILQNKFRKSSACSSEQNDGNLSEFENDVLSYSSVHNSDSSESNSKKETKTAKNNRLMRRQVELPYDHFNNNSVSGENDDTAVVVFKDRKCSIPSSSSDETSTTKTPTTMLSRNSINLNQYQNEYGERGVSAPRLSSTRFNVFKRRFRNSLVKHDDVIDSTGSTTSSPHHLVNAPSIEYDSTYLHHHHAALHDSIDAKENLDDPDSLMEEACGGLTMITVEDGFGGIKTVHVARPPEEQRENMLVSTTQSATDTFIDGKEADVRRRLSSHHDLNSNEVSNDLNNNVNRGDNNAKQQTSTANSMNLGELIKREFKGRQLFNIEPEDEKLRRRILSKRGAVHIGLTHMAQTQRRKYLFDFFNTMLDLQWRYVLIIFCMSFFLSWLFFATIWYVIVLHHGDLEPHNLPERQRYTDWKPCVYGIHNFVSCFLFSIETQHTIGYGSRQTSEECPEAVLVMSFQSVVGVMIQACMVGTIFAKLSRPKKRAETLMFSKNAVVCMRDGFLCLCYRFGNMRLSNVVDCHVRAILVSKKVTEEGEVIPYFQTELKVGTDMKGQVNSIFFAWPTTIIHRINESSPFYNMSATDFLRKRYEIFVILEGVVETTGMQIQARSSYLPNEILWGYRYCNDLHYHQRLGEYKINYSSFNSVVKVETPVCSARELDDEKMKMSKESNRQRLLSTNVSGTNGPQRVGDGCNGTVAVVATILTPTIGTVKSAPQKSTQVAAELLNRYNRSKKRNQSLSQSDDRIGFNNSPKQLPTTNVPSISSTGINFKNILKRNSSTNSSSKSKGSVQNNGAGGKRKAATTSFLHHSKSNASDRCRAPTTTTTTPLENRPALIQDVKEKTNGDEKVLDANVMKQSPQVHPSRPSSSQDSGIIHRPLSRANNTTNFQSPQNFVHVSAEPIPVSRGPYTSSGSSPSDSITTASSSSSTNKNFERSNTKQIPHAVSSPHRRPSQLSFKPSPYDIMVNNSSTVSNNKTPPQQHRISTKSKPSSYSPTDIIML